MALAFPTKDPKKRLQDALIKKASIEKQSKSVTGNARQNSESRMVQGKKKETTKSY
jgi:hypothetical protein